MVTLSPVTVYIARGQVWIKEGKPLTKAEKEEWKQKGFHFRELEELSDKELIEAKIKILKALKKKV